MKKLGFGLLVALLFVLSSSAAKADFDCKISGPVVLSFHQCPPVGPGQGAVVSVHITYRNSMNQLIAFDHDFYVDVTTWYYTDTLTFPTGAHAISGSVNDVDGGTPGAGYEWTIDSYGSGSGGDASGLVLSSTIIDI